MSLFDQKGFRGASHRSGPVQRVEIGVSSATPGYLPGTMREGTWSVELETHWIHPASRCSYTLEIDVLQSNLAQPMIIPEDARDEVMVNPAEGWYRGDLHTHTVHSDGVIEAQHLLSIAKENGLDFIALTDHNTISGLRDFLRSPVPGLLAIPGMELTTFRGHALAVGIVEWMDWRTGFEGREMAQNVLDTLSASGLFIIAHPIHEDDPVCTGCSWRYADTMPGKAHGVEVWNGAWNDRNEQSLHLWYEWLNKGHRITGTAGTDCHAPQYGKTQERNVGLNVVNSRSLSRSAILEGIRKGRLYLSCGPEISLRGKCGRGQWVPIGGAMEGREQDIEVGWRKCPEGSNFRLIIDGSVGEKWAATTEGTKSLSLTDSAVRWCLVELRDLKGQMAALTNPIYINR